MTSVHLLNQPVVLDLGSGLTKGGYAGTPEPSVVVGTLAGKPRLPKVLPTSTAPPSSVASDPSYCAAPNTRLRDAPPAPVSLLRDGGTSTSAASATDRGGADAAATDHASLVVGDALHALSGVLSVAAPVSRGVVCDWGAVERLWTHVAHDALAVAPGEHPFLVTEAAQNPHANRERLAQFFFESLSAPSLHVAIPAVLALFASGRTTGLVLDAGDGVTTALPVAHGHCDVHALRRLDIGGRDVTDRLLTLLRKSGASLFATSSERQAVRRMKERLGYVAVNPAGEEFVHSQQSPAAMDKRTKAFCLPDGNVVRVNVERFRAPEVLFQPHIIGLESVGIAEAVTAAVSGVDIGLRRNLYSSIVLAGGSTKFPGFPQRLLSDLRGLAPPDTKIRIHAPPDRLFSAFTGGTILASLSTTFRAMAITRAEYYEHGVSIVHRKTL